MNDRQRRVLKAEAALAEVLAYGANTYPEEERDLEKALGTLREIRGRMQG